MADDIDLDTFLANQSKSHYSFVVTGGSSPDDLDIYPFSIELGILHVFRLSCPKKAIEAVTPVGISAELGGRTHQVVNIVFTGEVGAACERAFEDLVDNLHRQGSRPVPMNDKSDADPGIFKPRRDWCGWHWPTPAQR